MIQVAALVLAMLAAPILAVAAEAIVSIPGGKAPLFGTLERPDGAATSAWRF